MSTNDLTDPYDPGPTREELFERLRHPELADAARDEILVMYYPFMYAAVHRISIPRQYHEQVISDVVESLARYLKSFHYKKELGRFRNYVMSCLKNAFRKRIGDEKRQAQSGFDPEFFDAAAPLDSLLDHTLEDEMRHAEVSRAFELALAGINPKHQSVMRAVIEAKQSSAQIASEFGISLDNLYQIVRRTRVRIREILDRMDDWPKGESSHPLNGD
jgi:RNA polymerase sigma factor (sigma-70 family)